MPRKLPGHLRLHIEESQSQSPPLLDDIQSLPRLCESFERATGWRLRHSPTPESDGLWRRRVGDPDWDDASWLTIGSGSAMAAALENGSFSKRWNVACDLAESIADLLNELQKTRRELSLREAELAAAIPVTPCPDEQKHLSIRLATILRMGVRAVGCEAAAAYMLDDATRELKLRACWGLPRSRFLEPPRPLRGAVGDLEALMGHAVILEDTVLASDWKTPEEFRSAVCLPISSPTVPLGTLWVYCDRPRGYSEDETNILEIVAGRVAAELERESLLNQSLHQKLINRQLLHAVQWQRSRLPQVKPILNSWQVAGWTSQADSLGGDFHDWSVLPDGTLAIAVGDAEGRMIEAGLTAAAVHTALKSHASYRHTACQMLERINETLWFACSGDQFASLFYAIIDPETGRLDYAGAGHVNAMLVGDSVYPLPTDAMHPLGTAPENRYSFATDLMAPGDILLVYSEGVQKVFPDKTAGNLLSRLLHEQRGSSADELIEQAQSFLARHTEGPPAEDQTLLVVKRA